MADFGEFLQSDQPVLHRMVRDNEDRRSRALVNGALEVVRIAGRCLPDLHSLGTRKADRLVHRCAIADHMARLDDHLVLQACRLRQALNGGKIVPCHGRRDCEADAG